MPAQIETESNKWLIKWAVGHFDVDITPVKVRSGAHSTVYKLASASENWFLKIGIGVRAEQERIGWLQNKVTVPQIIDFIVENGQEALLITAIKGIDLAHLSEVWPADKVVDSLAYALKTFHAIDASDCPFKAYQAGDVVVHGDACLPNFIFNKEGSFSGYVDLLDMGVGSVEVDLSAAVWSLQFNLGSGHGLSFLHQYGLKDADESEVERLRLMYEKSPIFER